MNNIWLALVIVLLLGSCQVTFGNTIKQDEVDWVTIDSLASNPVHSGDVVLRPKNKAVAISLAVTLGAFGVHRLYLGTSNKVPIIYTLTLGGGFGVLMVSDIVAIIAAKDINTYSPSEKVFMWAK